MTAYLIQQLEAEEIARLRQIRSLPPFSPGDTIKVHVKVTEGNRKRLQAFEGVCIERSRRGINERFTVRKNSAGEGVERVFPLHSPMIQALEVVRHGRVRKSKLYYLRDRRGRAARIPELLSRRTVGFDVGYTSAPFRRFFGKMIGAIKAIQALDGAAVGPEVLRVLNEVVGTLPQDRPTVVTDALSAEYVLTIADQLCPLLFSPDRLVATCARGGLERLSKLVDPPRQGHGYAGIEGLLTGIKASIVVNLSIRRAADKLWVELLLRDLLQAETGRPGLMLREPVIIQVSLDDLTGFDAEILVVDSIGLSHQSRHVFDVAITDQSVINRILTIVADGQEVCRLHLGDEMNRIFIL